VILDNYIHLDALRMITDNEAGAPLLSHGDFDNTQVAVVDNHDDGSYFDLWQLFAKRPTLRFHDIVSGCNINSIIIPLVGASNSIWQGD
jgi:EGF domain-specific O-GlcNAc transferase